VRMDGPATWWKKNSPIARAMTATVVPNSSTDAPALLNKEAALIEARLMATATTIAMTASSAMSQ
jgi:hypothetical protein